MLGGIDRDALLQAAKSNEAETNAAQFSKAYFVLGEMESFRGDFAQAKEDYWASERFAPMGLGYYATRQASRLPKTSVAAEVRTSGVAGVMSHAVPPSGKYYALLIGISNYPGNLHLKTPAEDAKAVGDLLAKSYGFKVSTLLDNQATRTGILSAINGYRAKLQPEDNLLNYC